MTWEEWALEELLRLVEANACRPWRELRRAMIYVGPSNGWPYKAWCRAKRQVLDGTAYGLPALPRVTATDREARGLPLLAGGAR